eukprot:TRINITY_DN12969_c0_g1_i1.p1 TRINITY_DN12969_c0_g1~~TRINITY_DN12969_c0_g1_i1.p1  ORF type:complete len:201 (-),score=19.81 TRINITY_DN12969_c0_g1_i1:84-686(-)
MASILEVRTQEEPSQYDSVSEAPSSLVSRQDWGSMTKGMKEIFSNLVGIRNKLQKIYHRQKPHTAEDIHKYQQMLDAIDSKREYGIFAGSLETGQIPPGQAACREVLDEAYDLVGKLMDTATPMNEAMTTVYKQLNGIIRKLANMKHDRSYTFEELRHYEQMVNAADSRRMNGIFCGSPQTVIPEGQAQCAERLAKCYGV